MATISDKVKDLANELEETAEADGASSCIFIVKGYSDRHIILNATISGEEALNLIAMLLERLSKVSGHPVKKIMSDIERGMKENFWEVEKTKGENNEL